MVTAALAETPPHPHPICDGMRPLPARGERRSKRRYRRLLYRPDQWRATTLRRAQMHADMAAASRSQSFEQPLQHFCAGAMIISDIIHQLPVLLADFEGAFGLRGHHSIILRSEQRVEERCKFAGATAAHRERGRDL